MSKELKQLSDQLGIDENRAIKISSGGTSLYHGFDIDPEDFLERAEDDYELGGSAALLNSITNAKRAIHCQIDQALICLGYNPKRWNLPKKAEQLVRVGFVAPRILKRVTDARNLLEHEYSSPTLPQVEEALDLAALFIEATNRHLASFGDAFNIGNSDEQVDGFHCKSELEFGFEEGTFRVWGRTSVSPELSHKTDVLVGKVLIKPDEEVFADVVRLVVAGDHESKVNKALKQFFATLSRF